MLMTIILSFLKNKAWKSNKPKYLIPEILFTLAFGVYFVKNSRQFIFLTLYNIVNDSIIDLIIKG